MKILCIGGVSDGQFREPRGERLTTAAMPERSSAAHYAIGQGWPSQPISPVSIQRSDYRVETMSFTTWRGVEKLHILVEQSLSPMQAFDLLINGYRQPPETSKTSAA